MTRFPSMVVLVMSGLVVVLSNTHLANALPPPRPFLVGCPPRCGEPFPFWLPFRFRDTPSPYHPPPSHTVPPGRDGPPSWYSKIIP
jgi:hypothetical protein